MSWWAFRKPNPRLPFSLDVPRQVDTGKDNECCSCFELQKFNDPSAFPITSLLTVIYFGVMSTAETVFQCTCHVSPLICIWGRPVTGGVVHEYTKWHRSANWVFGTSIYSYRPEPIIPWLSERGWNGTPPPLEGVCPNRVGMVPPPRCGKKRVFFEINYVKKTWKCKIYEGQMILVRKSLPQLLLQMTKTNRFTKDNSMFSCFSSTHISRHLICRF